MGGTAHIACSVCPAVQLAGSLFVSLCSFEGDLRVYFQCQGNDRVNLPDVTIEVSLPSRSPALPLCNRHMQLKDLDAASLAYLLRSCICKVQLC